MRPNPTDPAQWGGRLNIYVCDVCRSHVVTRDVDEGVTPFSIPSREFCPNKCGAHAGIEKHPLPASMTSSFYRVWDQSMREDYQWYRPAPGEAFHPAYRGHVENGGLLIRKHEA